MNAAALGRIRLSQLQLFPEHFPNRKVGTRQFHQMVELEFSRLN
jgi:hypothetical protein